MSNRLTNPTMEDNLKQVGDLLATLRKQIYQAVEDSYIQGWDNGVATKPNHEVFHAAHQEPQEYGEDGEILVVSGKVPMDQAVGLIYAKLQEWGHDCTENDVFSQTHSEKIALGTGDQEFDYYRGKNRNGIFDAWVWSL